MNGLTYIRKRCNISLGELAQILGVTRQAISSWENEHKAIPSQRKKQLSDFFGIDEKYFGDISEEDKIALLKKAMYRWNGLDKEAFLYREDKQNIPKEYRDRIYFVEERNMSLDEEYTLYKNAKQDLIKKIDISIDWSDMPNIKLQDQMTAINRGIWLYGCAYRLAEGMKEQENGLKMRYYLEVLNVLESMMHGLLEAPEMPSDCVKKEKEDVINELDEAWISHLSDEIRQRWGNYKNEYAEKKEKWKMVNPTEKCAPVSFTIHEAEEEYAKLFDADPGFRYHGLMMIKTEE